MAPVIVFTRRIECTKWPQLRHYRPVEFETSLIGEGHEKCSPTNWIIAWPLLRHAVEAPDSGPRHWQTLAALQTSATAEGGKQWSRRRQQINQKRAWGEIEHEHGCLKRKNKSSRQKRSTLVVHSGGPRETMLFRRKGIDKFCIFFSFDDAEWASRSVLGGWRLSCESRPYWHTTDTIGTKWVYMPLPRQPSPLRPCQWVHVFLAPNLPIISPLVLSTKS